MSNVVTKVEVVSAIAAKTGAAKADVERFMDAAQETYTEFLKQGKDVPVLGMGRLKVADRKARTQKTPKGDVVNIPASKSAKFSPAKKLKDSLNG